MGDVLIKPLSALRVKLTLTLCSQPDPPTTNLIQQQLEYLKGRKIYGMLVIHSSVLHAQ